MYLCKEGKREVKGLSGSFDHQRYCITEKESWLAVRTGRVHLLQSQAPPVNFLFSYSCQRRFLESLLVSQMFLMLMVEMVWGWVTGHCWN